MSSSTKKLTFDSHIDDAVGRANRALGTYLRSLQTSRAVTGRRFEPAPLVTAFNAHVRSILEFGSVIWSGAAKSHTVRLDRVQHTYRVSQNYPNMYFSTIIATALKPLKMWIPKFYGILIKRQDEMPHTSEVLS